MKKCSLINMGVICILCSFFLTACGGTDDQQTITREHYVIQEEAEVLFKGDAAHNTWTLMGTQYVDGQAVQIRAYNRKDENGQMVLDIYLCKPDGTVELLLGSASAEYRKSMYLCSDGGLFVYSAGNITGLDKNGAELFTSRLRGQIRDVCEVSDDVIALLIYDVENNTNRLVQMNAQTGAVDESKDIYLGDDMYQYITRGESGILLLNAHGIFRIDLADGTQSDIFSFKKTGYEMKDGNGTARTVSDFRVNGEGAAELLCGATQFCLTRVNVAEVRDILFVRVRRPETELKNSVTEFNKQNETYYVVLKTPDEGESVVDFWQRTNMQLGVGEGADIIVADAIGDVLSLLEKGVLLELNPYMEQSGIREEDYFPIAFSNWRDGDKIYGVHMSVQLKECWILEEVVKGIDTLTVESLVDALFKYDKNAVFSENWSSEQVLNYFLCGSESIWGMVDWENANCDFGGELFGKILKVAKRYGDGEQNNYPSVSGSRKNAGLYRFDYLAQLQSEGKIPMGYFFDDGEHVTINSAWTMAINNNSPYIDGAWEFIAYLLTEGQGIIEADNATSATHPVSRSAFDAMAQSEITQGSVVYEEVNGRNKRICKGGGVGLYAEIGEEAYKAIYDITEEKAAEVKATLEDARALPVRNLPILEIIYEEAAAYFSDSKSIEEVVAVIENRVGLYLSEQN